MNNLEKIKILEQQVFQIKTEINSLLSQENSTEIEKAKLYSLQCEINSLNMQISTLLNAPSKNVSENVVENTVVKQNIVNVKNIEQVPPMQQPIKSPVQNKKKDFNMESFFGKNMMGIVGAAFTFIALVFFSLVVFANFGDQLKLASMFVFSFAILGFGLYRLKKQESTHIFNLIITATGVSAIFICIFIGHIYFKLIILPVVFVCLLAWLVLIFFLSRIQTNLFVIIGEVGLIISAIAGACKYGDFDIYMIILFVVAQFAFMFIARNKSQLTQSIFHVGANATFLFYNIVYLMAKSLQNMNGFDFFEVVNATEVNNVAIIVSLCFAIISLVFIFIKTKKEYFGVNAIVSTFTINILLIVSKFFEEDTLSVIMLIFVIALFVVYKIFQEVSIVLELESLIIAPIFIFIVLGKFNEYISHLNDYTLIETHIFFATPIIAIFGLSLLIIALMVLKSKENSTIYEVFVNIYLFLNFIIVSNFDGAGTAYIILNAIFAILPFILFIIYYFKEETTTASNTCFYIASLLTVSSIISNFNLKITTHNTVDACFSDTFYLGTYITVILLTALQVLFAFLKFNKEKVTGVFFCIANAIIIFYIGCNEYRLNEFFIILMLAILICVNVTNIIDRFNTVGYVYIGIKFTLFITYTLNLFEASSFVYSIAFFVIAIIFIALGMFKYIKPFRIYGLVLSLISTVKLLLIDIQYSSLTSRAVSFLICGILCFAISFLYNKLDKIFNEK